MNGSVKINNTQMERNYSLDALKGVAITLVVLGHSIQFGLGTTYFEELDFWNNLLYVLIYSFHMPLFALISGYLLFSSIQKRSLINYVKKQLLHLGVPILCWAIVSYLVTIILYDYNGGLINYVMGYLWFLRVLLVDSIIIALIVKCFKSQKLQIILLTIVLVAALFIPDVWKYNRAVYLLPYFIAGYYAYPQISSTSFQRKVSSWDITITIGIIFFLLFLGFDKEYIYGYFPQATFIFQNGYSFDDIVRQIYINGYRWIIGLAGSLFVILLGSRIFAGKKNVIAIIGTYSMSIYIISDLLNGTLLKWASRSFDLSCFISIITVILEVLLMLMLTIGLTKIISKSRYLNMLLFGKR